MSILRNRAKENVPWPKSAPIYAAALIILTYCLTAFTGLKYTIPGYPSAKSRQAALDNMAKVDSLERVMDMWSAQISNIQRIVGGQTPADPATASPAGGANVADTTGTDDYAVKDSLLREAVRGLDQALEEHKNGTDK